MEFEKALYLMPSDTRKKHKVTNEIRKRDEKEIHNVVVKEKILLQFLIFNISSNTCHKILFQYNILCDITSNDYITYIIKKAYSIINTNK